MFLAAMSGSLPDRKTTEPPPADRVVENAGSFPTPGARTRRHFAGSHRVFGSHPTPPCVSSTPHAPSSFWRTLTQISSSAA